VDKRQKPGKRCGQDAIGGWLRSFCTSHRRA